MPAAPKTSWGTPSQGADKKHPGAGSALEGVMDVLDVPLAAAEAAPGDLLYAAKTGNWLGETPGEKRISTDLAQGGAHQVAQNDIYFRVGSLKRVLADPNASEGQKATAQMFLKNPWAAGAGDFVAEFANPSNVVLGPVVGKAAELGLMGARLIPGVGRALDAAADYGHTLFNKYALLRKVSPRAAAIGRQSDAQARAAQHANQTLTHEIFNPNEAAMGLRGGTTTEEQTEIMRRAFGDTPMTPEQLRETYPHFPGFTPPGRPYHGTLSDEAIDEAAAKLRAANEAADQTQLERGMLHPDEQMTGYFRMDPRTDYNPEVFGREGDMPTQVNNGGRVTNVRYRGPQGGHKEFRSPTEVMEANEYYAGQGQAMMRPDFRWPVNVVKHLNRVSGNVALDELVKTMAHEAPEAAQELAQPYEEGIIPAGEVTTGTGPKQFTREVPAGYKIAAKTIADAKDRARSTAVARAIDDVASAYGLSDADKATLIRTHFADPGKLRARLAELKMASRNVERLGKNATGVAERTAQTLSGRADDLLAQRADVEAERNLPRPADTDAQAAATAAEQAAQRAAPRVRAAQQEARRAANVAARTPQGSIRAADRENVRMAGRANDLFRRMTDPRQDMRAEFVTARNAYYRDLKQKYIEAAVKGVVPEGYKLISDVPGLSGLERLHYTAVKPEVEKYLVDYGTPRPQAQGVAAFFDRFNWLYRMGIVINPVVHPFKNLFWAYLGMGANPIRLARMFRASATDLDHEAESYGAHAMFPESSALGGSTAAMLMGTLRQAPGGAAGKADWLLSRLTNANRRLVFERLERNMATEAWDDLTQKNLARGMDEVSAKRAAAEAVRKGMGDYNNITKAEEMTRYALYFYPWMKTVIPFWLSAGLKRPQLITAPLRAIQTHNAVAGDPNIASENMGTIYNGPDASGQPSYTASGLPQTRIAPVLGVAAPRVAGQADPQAGIPARLNDAANIAQEHLTPALADVGTFARTLANQEPEEPGVTPRSDTMFNRDAPLGVQAGQIGSYVAQTGVPFGGQVSNLAQALRLAVGGNPSAIPATLLGGYNYSQRTPIEQRILNRYLDAFARTYDKAFKLPPGPRNQMQADSYAIFRKKVNLLLGRPRKAAPQPPLQTLQSHP